MTLILNTASPFVCETVDCAERASPLDRDSTDSVDSLENTLISCHVAALFWRQEANCCAKPPLRRKDSAPARGHLHFVALARCERCQRAVEAEPLVVLGECVLRLELVARGVGILRDAISQPSRTLVRAWQPGPAAVERDRLGQRNGRAADGEGSGSRDFDCVHLVRGESGQPTEEAKAIVVVGEHVLILNVVTTLQ